MGKYKSSLWIHKNYIKVKTPSDEKHICKDKSEASTKGLKVTLSRTADGKAFQISSLALHEQKHDHRRFCISFSRPQEAAHCYYVRHSDPQP